MNHHLFYIQLQPWHRLDTSPSWGLVIWLNHHTIVYFCLSTTTTTPTRYMLFPRTCHLTKLPYDRFLFVCQPRPRSLLNTCSSRGLVIWLNFHMIVFCLHDENSLSVCTDTHETYYYLSTPIHIVVFCTTSHDHTTNHTTIWWDIQPHDTLHILLSYYEFVRIPWHIHSWHLTAPPTTTTVTDAKDKNPRHMLLFNAYPICLLVSSQTLHYRQ